MTIVEKARQFVETECKKPTSMYGYGPYIEHFVPMVKHSNQLCKKLGGDLEIVLLASWLHDIGSIIYGRKDHHITSAKIAKDFLTKDQYDKKKIKLIEKCILHHRQSTNIKRESL
jgi:HD superfamily phosphodiesterase